MDNKLNTEEKATAKPMLANRLLKFRGRKPNSKNWEFFDMNDYFLNDNGSFPLFLEYKMINICQFTEELDKKGNEVYEGDIVKLIFNEYYSNDCVTVDEESIVVGKVVFESGGYFINEKDSTWYYLFDMQEVSEIEILGNIYDNPELLQTTS